MDRNDTAYLFFARWSVAPIALLEYDDSPSSWLNCRGWFIFECVPYC